MTSPLTPPSLLKIVLNVCLFLFLQCFMHFQLPSCNGNELSGRLKGYPPEETARNVAVNNAKHPRVVASDGTYDSSVKKRNDLSSAATYAPLATSLTPKIQQDYPRYVSDQLPDDMNPTTNSELRVTSIHTKNNLPQAFQNFKDQNTKSGTRHMEMPRAQVKLVDSLENLRDERKQANEEHSAVSGKQYSNKQFVIKHWKLPSAISSEGTSEPRPMETEREIEQSPYTESKLQRPLVLKDVSLEIPANVKNSEKYEEASTLSNSETSLFTEVIQKNSMQPVARAYSSKNTNIPIHLSRHWPGEGHRDSYAHPNEFDRNGILRRPPPFNGNPRLPEEQSYLQVRPENPREAIFKQSPGQIIHNPDSDNFRALQVNPSTLHMHHPKSNDYSSVPTSSNLPRFSRNEMNHEAEFYQPRDKQYISTGTRERPEMKRGFDVATNQGHSPPKYGREDRNFRPVDDINGRRGANEQYGYERPSSDADVQNTMRAKQMSPSNTHRNVHHDVNYEKSNGGHFENGNGHYIQQMDPKGRVRSATEQSVVQNFQSHERTPVATQNLASVDSYRNSQREVRSPENPRPDAKEYEDEDDDPNSSEDHEEDSHPNTDQLKTAEAIYHWGMENHKDVEGYFQYANIPKGDTYEYGYRMGSPRHIRERYHQTKNTNSKIKVNWEDENGDFGDQYWEFNHGSSTHDQEKQPNLKSYDSK